MGAEVGFGAAIKNRVLKVRSLLYNYELKEVIHLGIFSALTLHLHILIMEDLWIRQDSIMWGT